jgi:hypothetical protein
MALPQRLFTARPMAYIIKLPDVCTERQKAGRAKSILKIHGGHTMRFNKLLCGLLVLVMTTALCACGAPGDAATPTLTIAVSTPEPPTSTLQLAPQPTPEPTPESTPAVRSYTTGIPVAALGEYKPIGVMIENAPAARPQYGLQAADIVYEAPVEGCTRFFCIYNDTLPEKVGPVRSARIYYLQIQQEWDCAYVHFGGPSSGKANVYKSSSDSIKTRIDFIKGKYNDYYWRDKNVSAPHNAFTDVQKCQTLVKEESKVRSFLYADTPQYTGTSVAEVVLPFYAGEVTYKYSAEKDVLERYMGGKPFTDATTDETVAVKNLIVQYCKFYHGGEDKGRWLAELVGTGKAEFFIGGKHIDGTWSRDSYEAPTVYKDGSGNEIVLQPGNTWIAMHPQDEAITVR